MKKIFWLLPFLCFTIYLPSVPAQENDFHFSHTIQASRYQTETIHLRFATYMKNKERFEIGLVGEGLKPEMMVSPEAMVIFKKYQRQRRWSVVCAGVQLVAQVAALTTRNRSLRTGLFISSGAISVVAIPLYIGSQKNLNNAIWIRNGDVLKYNHISTFIPVQ